MTTARQDPVRQSRSRAPGGAALFLVVVILTILCLRRGNVWVHDTRRPDGSGTRKVVRFAAPGEWGFGRGFGCGRGFGQQIDAYGPLRVETTEYGPRYTRM